MSRWKISMHLCGDLLTNEEKISHTLTNPILQRIHHWPLKRKRMVLYFWFGLVFNVQSTIGLKRQLLHKKYTHVVYDFWTMFSQKKISSIHCRQKTDGFESRAHTLCNPPLGLCYHGGDLRVTALKDQNTERPTLFL